MMNDPNDPNNLNNPRYPNMLDNWKHLMLDSKAEKVWEDFHEELVQLADYIDALNDTRRWRINDFNPKHINISVAS